VQKSTMYPRGGVMAEPDDSNWGKYLGYGLEMAVGVALGLWVGSWIDKRYGSAPWGVLICVFLGLAAGMYMLIRDGIAANKD
jgi:F0F1-type ATP synthase assembly protein I